jgi:hypothetical protein
MSNTQWQFADTVGRFRVDLDTINGRSTKVIRCVTAGPLYITRHAMQQESGAMAFGELEVWVYKPDAGAIAITFNNTSINGAIGNANELYMAAGEEVGVQRYAGGAWAANNFQTAAGFCPILTWTKFTVKRTVAGVYTTYMNDTLVTPVAVGANPFTDVTYLTSETIRIQLGVGCKLALGSVDGANAFVKRLKG